MKTIAEDFVAQSTLHGVSHLTGEKTLVRRLIWLVFFLVAIAIGVYQIVFLFQNLKSNALIASTKIIYQKPMLFPTVTIYNMNAMKI